MTFLSRFLVFFLFVAIVVSFERVLAAEESGIGITIHPYLSDIVLRDEERVPFSVELSNNSGERREFSLSAIDFGGLESSAGVAFLGSDQDIEREFDPAKWIETEATAVSLESKETKTLSGSIVNSEDLSPGGHYGAILFQTKKPMDSVGPTNVSIDERIAALIFIRKEGGAIYGMNLRSFSPDRRFIGIPEAFSLSLQNTGNVHIVPRGRIDVKDPFGRSVAKGIVNEDSSLLLPKGEKTYPVRFLPLERAYFPGTYTIEINVRYDGKEAFESQKMNFFVMPIPSVIFGSIVILSLFFIVWKKRRERQS